MCYTNEKSTVCKVEKGRQLMKKFLAAGLLAYMVLMLIGMSACVKDEEDVSYNYDWTTKEKTTTTTYNDPDGPGWLPGFY